MAWLTGWGYRKKHDIEGSTAGSVTDYQVKIVCHYGSGTDSGEDVYLNEKCRTDFGDIRFTKDDGETLLDYWMEKKVDSDYAIFWVKVPSIPASPDSVSIYVYYGKSDAVYDGDPEQVFDLYEDFDELADGEDPSGWTDYNNKWAVDSGWYRSSVYSGAESNWNACCVNTGFEVSNHEIRLKVSRLHEGTIPNFYVFFRASDLGSDLSGVVDGYAAILHGGNDELQLRRYDNGSSTTLSSANQTYGLETYNVKIRAYGSSLEVECDSVSVSATDSTYSSGYLAFTKHNLDVKIDEVIVRKYIDPEPSHGAWYAEETPVVTLELTETLTISDFRPVFSTSKTFTESTSISDVLSKLVAKTFTESLSLSDVVSALRVKVKELVETIGLSDVVVKFASIVRSETITVSDVLEKVKTMYREFVETIGLSDRISKLTSIVKTETLSLTDILEKRFVILKVLTETLGLSDTLARIRIKKTLARIKGVTRILNAIREKPAERELGR